MNVLHLSAFEGRFALQLPHRALAVSCVLIAALALLGIASLMFGASNLPLAALWGALTGPQVGPQADQMAATVVWQFRMPRVLVAFWVGAFLALSGATLQYVTRNPLADPSLIGVSQGAALVVVASTILAPGLGAGWLPLLAMGGALAVAGFILLASATQRGGETLRFILMGIGVAALISSFTQALLTYGDIDRSLSALGWLAGSIHTAGWPEVRWLTLTALLGVPLLAVAVRPLSALRFGDEIATGLGVAVKGSRWLLVALSVGLAATAVSAVGPLAFVGLVAPHLARRLASCGVGLQLVLTGLTGALMVGAADFVGRVAFLPTQIPAGLLTAILAGPVFVALILRSQARSPL